MDRRLELGSEAPEVEVGELLLIQGVGVDPLREGGDVDLRLSVRESASAFDDSMRIADARAAAFACSPFQRVAWYPLQAVATVATASSTVALNSSRAARPCRNSAHDGIAAPPECTAV